MAKLDLPGGVVRMPGANCMVDPKFRATLDRSIRQFALNAPVHFKPGNLLRANTQNNLLDSLWEVFGTYMDGHCNKGDSVSRLLHRRVFIFDVEDEDRIVEESRYVLTVGLLKVMRLARKTY